MVESISEAIASHPRVNRYSLPTKPLLTLIEKLVNEKVKTIYIVEKG
jgi:hypothetical protein